MTDTYTDHFTSHVHNLLWLLRESERKSLDELAESISLSDEQKLDLAGRLTSLRSRRCRESFTLGMEMGMRIADRKSVV